MKLRPAQATRCIILQKKSKVVHISTRKNERNNSVEKQNKFCTQSNDIHVLGRYGEVANAVILPYFYSTIIVSISDQLWPTNGYTLAIGGFVTESPENYFCRETCC